ncbi:MAG: lactonase family protein [Aureibaculum sp.]|nr:lactonase family protein [Aureibaculum sp.]
MNSKIILLVLALITTLGCEKANKKQVQENKTYSFFVGTYTDGDSQGIYKYSLQKDGKLSLNGLAAISDNPSFLTKSTDSKYLIAVNEISNKDTVGSAESFLIQSDTLKLINRSSSGGAHPCFVTVNEAGYVLTANYTGGNVGLLQLNSQGELTGLLDLQQHSGSNTTDRQKGPHAHSTWFTPKNNDVISVDLGTNELWFSKLDTEAQKLVPSNPNTLAMEPGAGPRHLTFHPNGQWLYVVNELNGTVTLVEKTIAGAYQKKGSVSTLPVDYNKPNSCADIHISSDGKFLYVSNRGHNSIAIFKVSSDDGALTLVAHEATRGDGPRNFSLTPDENFLLVANQHSNNIISFKRNTATGLLEYVDEIKAPTPVCILF